MSSLLALYVAIPLFASIVTLVLGPPSTTRRFFSIATQGLLAALSLFLVREAKLAGPLSLAVGNWVPPFGISLTADVLGALFLLTGQTMAFFVFLYEMASRGKREEPRALFPLLHVLSAGASLAFLTGDFFNLFVAFEVLLVSSYGLLTLEPVGKRVKDGYPYVMLNILGSTIFLMAAGFAYASWGTLNFADLSTKMTESEDGARKQLFGWICLGAFGLKAGLVPLHFWLPRAYPMLRPGLAALFAALLTKVGIYTLLRLGTTVTDFAELGLSKVLLWGGLVTLIFGGLGAVSRSSLRGILAFHIVSQIGYMLAGLGLGGALALTGALLFAIHNMLVKGGLFLAGGLVLKAQGTDELSETGGFFDVAPFASSLFLLLALALSGLPPLTGFWSKYVLLSGSLAQGQVIPFLFFLAGGFLTLFSMIKMWVAAYWGKASRPAKPLPRRLVLVPAVLAGLVVLLSLGLGDLPGLAELAIEQAGNREEIRVRTESLGEKGR